METLARVREIRKAIRQHIKEIARLEKELDDALELGKGTSAAPRRRLSREMFLALAAQPQERTKK